jgi:hypothetical protein
VGARGSRCKDGGEGWVQGNLGRGARLEFSFRDVGHGVQGNLGLRLNGYDEIRFIVSGDGN